MGNFNFKNLVLIDDQSESNERSRLVAHTEEGIKIFEGLLKFNEIEDAVNELKINLVIGFTRRAGKSREISHSYEEYFKDFFKNIKEDSMNVALVFGNEDDGISDIEIENCNILLYIKSLAGSPSLNLSHAVCLVLNEIFNYSQKKEDERLSGLALDIENIFIQSTPSERKAFYREIIDVSKKKKLFIKNDEKTFRRLFERIFSSPGITTKDLLLLKRQLLRFIFAQDCGKDDEERK